MKGYGISVCDDMVVLAKNKLALEDMMDTLKSFLKRRKLELCTEKTKIIVFNSKERIGKEK